MNNPPPRQMIGKVPPRPLAGREALHLDAPRLGRRVIFPGLAASSSSCSSIWSLSRWLRSERGPNISCFILAITNCRCSINASAPTSLARASISPAMSSGR
jgi:hypothetical protein